MVKLKLGPLTDEKLKAELPANVHRDLIAYAEALGRESDQQITDPTKLIAPMLARFMSTDRAFAKSRKLPRTT